MVTKSTLSARGAARLLGFDSANPILDAIRAGELEAYQRPARRNGAAGQYEITRQQLAAWAAPRGLHLDGEPEPAAEPATVESNVEPFEMIRELHIPFRSPAAQLVEPASPAFTAGVLGVVTIPTEHYAALVAARAELEFTKANFELTWRGPSRAETVKSAAPELGGEIHAVAPTSATPGRGVRRRAAAK